MNIAGAIGSLTAQKFRDDAVAVTYSRGATELEITAVLGRTQWQGEDSEGITVTMEAPDWFVRASELGAMGAPQSGDRITAAGAAQGTAVYEVCAPAAGEHVFQWADAPNRVVYRVHTKQVGED
jgi:hypothetical protein